MGIFGSQGEYAKLAPLFVDKFDTEPTFSKINKGYSDFDELSKINATNALNYEQFEANSITGKYQKALQQVDAGEISPFKAVRLAKETAHAYVNDPTRRNYEMSKMNDDLSMKENQGKQSTYGAREIAHAKWLNEGGGSGTKYLNQWSASKDLSLSDIATKVASNANEDSKGGAGWRVDPSTNKIITTGTSREWLSRDKVYNNTLQVVNADPEINKFLEETAYGELYDRMNASFINNPETANLPEKARKALIYQELMAPRRTEKKDKDGNVTVDTRSYLQRQVDAKKQNVVAGIAGLKAYEKTDIDYKFDSLPEGDGSKAPNSDIAGGYAESDDSEQNSPFAEGYQSGTTNDITSATSLGKTIGSNTLTGAVNTGKALIDMALGLTNLGATGPNASKGSSPKFEPIVTRAERLTKILPDVKKQLESEGINTKDLIPLKKDGSNLDEVHRQLVLKSEQSEAVKRERFKRPTARIPDKNLGDLLSRVDMNSDMLELKNDKDEKSSVKFSQLVKNAEDYGIEFPDKMTDDTESGKAKYLQENIKVSGVTAKGDRLYVKGSIGTKDIYFPIKDVTMKNAYSGLQSVDKLFKAKFEDGKASVPIPDSNKGAIGQGYTNMVKQSSTKPGSKNIVISYYYTKPDGTKSQNFTSDELSREYANLGKYLLQGSQAYNELFTDKKE